jgi:hypothetical protein
MGTSNGSGLFLMLLLVALFLLTIFLFQKRKNKDILGNKFLLPVIFVGLIIVFFFARGAIVSYYQSIFKTAPYEFSDLKSIVFKYGPADSLVNQYNSATGEYQYINKKNSLTKTHVYLTATDRLYLYRKAAEVGFWDFPSNEKTYDTTNTNGVKPLEFLIQFNYKQKSKTVIFNSSYNGPDNLVQANRLLVQEIQTVLSNAEDRQK